MKFYYAFSAAFREAEKFTPPRTAPQGLRQGLYRLKVAPWKESDGTSADVRFGSKADMCSAKRHVRFTPKSGHFGKADDLCSVLARSTELGFDESGEGKNLRPRPLHSDLFQNRLELLTKLVKGRSRLPNIDHAPAARHRPGNVRE